MRVSVARGRSPLVAGANDTCVSASAVFQVYELAPLKVAPLAPSRRSRSVRISDPA